MPSPDPRYGAAGFCDTCYYRFVRRMRKRYKKSIEGRNIPAELEAFEDALSLKYNAAQRLFNEE